MTNLCDWQFWINHLLKLNMCIYFTKLIIFSFKASSALQSWQNGYICLFYACTISKLPRLFFMSEYWADALPEAKAALRLRKCITCSFQIYKRWSSICCSLSLIGQSSISITSYDWSAGQTAQFILHLALLACLMRFTSTQTNNILIIS